MKYALLAAMLAGCGQPEYTVEIFRGEDQVCAKMKVSGETVRYQCVPVESLGINRDELG